MCDLRQQRSNSARGDCTDSVTTPWPKEAWERIAVDIRGPDGTLGLQNRMAVVIIDYYSKWAEVDFMQETTAARIVEMFRRLFHREGVPKVVTSDNEVQFISTEFKKMIEEFGITHHRSSIYHPMGNALVERFNKTLGGFIETAKTIGGDKKKKVLEMIGIYNATPQATTGKSPAELLHGRRMRTRLDVVDHRKTLVEQSEIREQVSRLQCQQEKYANTRKAVREEQLRPGDWVRTRKQQPRKGTGHFETPIQIKKKIGKKYVSISRRENMASEQSGNGKRIETTSTDNGTRRRRTTDTGGVRRKLE